MRIGVSRAAFMPIFSNRQRADIESKLFSNQSSDAGRHADVWGNSSVRRSADHDQSSGNDNSYAPSSFYIE